MKKKHLLFWIIFLVVIVSFGSFACKKEPKMMEGDMPPFGGEYDVKYSQHLWKALMKAKLVGPGAMYSVPYTGQSPHGTVLETISTTVKVKGHEGEVHVKSNYGAPGLTRSMVAQDRPKYLKAITVMFKREAGYDADNKDWYWVKYNPDGTLGKNPKGMMLAGRVAKGAKKGCIACHKWAEGGDYLFNNTAAQLDK